MAGTEHGAEQARRRFITRHHVEDAAAAGQPIRVQGRDVLTDEAAQRAADLGVAIERTRAATSDFGASAMPTPSSAPSTAAVPAARAGSDADLRRAIRAAVVAELGAEPSELDAAIDRVLKARSR